MSSREGMISQVMDITGMAYTSTSTTNSTITTSMDFTTMTPPTAENQAGAGQFSYLMIIYLSMICPFIILGNFFILLAVIKNVVLHKFSFVLLASLAISDLLVGLITIPLFLCWTTGHEMFNNNFFCKVVLSNSLFCTSATVVNLIVITLDRYLAICWPIQHKVLMALPHIKSVTVFLIWFLSLFFTVLCSFTMEVNNRTCAYYNVFDPNTLLIMLVLGMFVPLLAMAFMYIRMYYVTRSHFKFMLQSYKTAIPNSMPRKSMSATRKMLVTSVIIFIAFFLTWGPFLVVILIKVTCGTCFVSNHILDFVLLMGFSNSYINPIIYTYRNRVFQNLLHKLIFRHSNLPTINKLSSDSFSSSRKQSNINIGL